LRESSLIITRSHEASLLGKTRDLGERRDNKRDLALRGLKELQKVAHERIGGIDERGRLVVLIVEVANLARDGSEEDSSKRDGRLIIDIEVAKVNLSKTKMQMKKEILRKGEPRRGRSRQGGPRHQSDRRGCN